MPLTAIGRYQIFAELGAGGFATVYRAVDPMLHRDVAIKVLHPHLARDPLVRARFIAEGRSLARIRHPNLVQVYDAGEVDELVFLAMEFVPGRSLDAVAAGRTLGVDEAAPIIAQVAAALDAIHAARLVHRDVKPANIMIAEDGRVVLLDLGVARALDRSGLTSSGALVGTPSYLAPEQVEGSDEVGPATDLYQLGATAYALLAGQPPFTGSTAQVLLAVVRDEPPDLAVLRPDLPPYVTAAIREAMAKRPEQRPASAGAFAASLASGPLAHTLPMADTPESTAARRDTPAARPTAGRDPARDGGRRRWLAIAAGLVAVVAMAAGLVVLGRTGGRDGDRDQSRGGTASPPEGDATGRGEVASFRGYADGPVQLGPVELKAGLVVLRARHPGGGNFIVELILPKPGVNVSEGYDLAMTLINEIGQYNGGAAASLRKGGAYVLRVDARSSYQITVEQPTRAPAATAGQRTFSGQGQQVTPIFTLPAGRITVRATHDGKGSFQVWLYDLEGGSVGGRLVSAIGATSQSVAVEVLDGPHLFHVKADGNWTIAIE